MSSFQIQNKYLQVTVKQEGAEICSIKSTATGKEFIWDAKPEIWPHHAPILFPIVGALKDDTFRYKDQEYNLPQHGFMRQNKQVQLLEKSETGLSFVLKSNEATIMVYPFEFEFITKYSLYENYVVIEHEVYNLSYQEMFFSLGAHPAFKCPVNPGELYSDYYLEFEKEENSKACEIVGGLIGIKRRNIFDSTKKINLHSSIFNKGALVFKDLKSTWISLRSKQSNQRVTIHFKGFPYMGIWAKPNAPFVCIEPWFGIADSVNADQEFSTKEGIIKLAANGRFAASYDIEINE